ncbi:hypothetical protein BDV12DRAFT_166945 [Aspergillus spectabilis]
MRVLILGSWAITLSYSPFVRPASKTKLAVFEALCSSLLQFLVSSGLMQQLFLLNTVSVMSELTEKGCIVCGWTLDKQIRCDYTSHLKLFYRASTRVVWSIGSDVTLNTGQTSVLERKLKSKH